MLVHLINELWKLLHLSAEEKNLTQVFTSTVFNYYMDITPSSSSVLLDQQQNQNVFYICSFSWLREQKEGQFVGIFLGRIKQSIVLTES